MGLRQTLNSNGRGSMATVVIAVLLAVALLTCEMWPSGSAEVSNLSFYTIDNGKTWFRDTLFKVPPFDNNGTPAYRAIVYRASGKEFVAYLLRFRPETAKLLNEALANQKAGKMSSGELQVLILSDRVRGGTEVAKPGPKLIWMPLSKANLGNVTGPDGTSGEMVSP